jgi:hypothetical protein
MGPWTFTLSSLFLVMTLVSVSLGLMLIAPGLGVLLLVITAPAMVRAAQINARRAAAGQPTDALDRFMALLGSVGVVVATGLAAGGAFFGTCVGVFVVTASSGQGYDRMGLGLALGLGAGAIVGLVFLVQIGRWLWKSGSRS